MFNKHESNLVRENFSQRNDRFRSNSVLGFDYVYLLRQARSPQSLSTTLVGLHQPSPVSGQAVSGQGVRGQDATHWRVKRF